LESIGKIRHYLLGNIRIRGVVTIRCICHRLVVKVEKIENQDGGVRINWRSQDHSTLETTITRQFDESTQSAHTREEML
jgi:hypothetical protein